MDTVCHIKGRHSTGINSPCTDSQVLVLPLLSSMVDLLESESGLTEEIRTLRNQFQILANAEVFDGSTIAIDSLSNCGLERGLIDQILGKLANSVAAEPSLRGTITPELQQSSSPPGSLSNLQLELSRSESYKFYIIEPSMLFGYPI